jgi:hypothetical protein
MELNFKNIFTLMLLSAANVSAQHNSGYFSQRELQQQQAESNRWMSNLQNSVYQPNPSSTQPYYKNWNLNAQPDSGPEPETQLSLEQQRNYEEQRLKRIAEYEAQQQAAKKAEAERLYKLWLVKKNKTDEKRNEINSTREKFKEQIAAKNAGAYALLGVVSYPLLKQSRWYFEQAFKQNPGEYAILPALADYINSPYPGLQNRNMRVLKLAEISSNSSYLPFKLYSCALMMIAANNLVPLDSAASKRADAYAQRLADNCVANLPATHRNSESLKYLITAPVHLYPGSRAFWEDTNDGLDVEKLKSKFAVLPVIGNPADYLQDEEFLK